VVTRLDNGDAPLQLRAVQLPAGLVLEPVTVSPGATLVDVPFIAAAGPVSLVLEGVAAGNVLGKTHPISIDTSNRAVPKAIPDEN
jgi:hypothetical protein